MCLIKPPLENLRHLQRNTNLSTKQAKSFHCTAEHLITKQDDDKNCANNTLAACHYCNQKCHKCKSPKNPIPYKQYVTNKPDQGKSKSHVIYGDAFAIFAKFSA